MDLFMVFSRTFGMPGSSKKTAVARVTRQQGGRVGGHEDIDVVEMGCQYPGVFVFGDYDYRYTAYGSFLKKENSIRCIISSDLDLGIRINLSCSIENYDVFFFGRWKASIGHTFFEDGKEQDRTESATLWVIGGASFRIPESSKS